MFEEIPFEVHMFLLQIQNFFPFLFFVISKVYRMITDGYWIAGQVQFPV